MKKLTIFQYTVLARLIARDLSEKTSMKIDCRSLPALRDRGLIEYCGTSVEDVGWSDGMRHNQAFMEKTAAVTEAGVQFYKEDRKLRAEVATHLRLERDRALERASSYEATARMLRSRAGRWDDAHSELGGTR